MALRASAPTESDDAIAACIDRLLAARRAGATVCPSEVARDLRGGGPEGWRERMPDVRRVAGGLAAAGRLRVTRRGEEVDAESPGGPIRLGRTEPRS